MVRGHHREPASGPSQRSLRAGELVRHALATMVFVLSACTVASAEVCDKVVGEHWRPGDGPAWTYMTPSLWSILPLGWLIILGPLCVLVLGILRGHLSFAAAICLKWFSYLAAAFLTLGAYAVLHDRIFPDGIMVAAVNEGCITLRRQWIDLGLLPVGALLYGWAVHRVRRLEQAAEAEHRRLVGYGEKV